MFIHIDQHSEQLYVYSSLHTVLIGAAAWATTRIRSTVAYMYIESETKSKACVSIVSAGL